MIWETVLLLKDAVDRIQQFLKLLFGLFDS